MTDIIDAALCRGRRHTGTNDAWNLGCRCPGALSAHAEWLKARRRRRAAVQAVTGGPCGATTHNTLYAFEMAGCRCPRAIELDTAERRRKAVKRGQRTMVQKRRDWWRGPRTKVSAINLWMLIRGFPDSPTNGETLAAVAILSGTVVTDVGLGGRPMPADQIAMRLGVSERKVGRYRAERQRRARGRAVRRAVDAEIKRERVAAAQGRKERVAAEHAAAMDRRTGSSRT